MVLAIVQARMGSSRLPGKSLMMLNGKPAIWHVINRVKMSRLVDKIVVATTVSHLDDQLSNYCGSIGVECYRGSEEDVLERYYRCAEQFGADVIVRITGDCPVIDPTVIDECIGLYSNNTAEDFYVSNCIERTYPDGLDVEVFSFSALEQAFKLATLKSEREHVTPFIKANKPSLHLINPFGDFSRVRLTLDYIEDLQILDHLVKDFKSSGYRFTLKDLLLWWEMNPDLVNLNSKYEINEGLKKSLENDEVIKKLEENCDETHY